MKDKILYLILGILIGAVITAGCFLVFSKANNKNGMPSDMTRENMEQMREKPDWDDLDDRSDDKSNDDLESTPDATNNVS